MKRKKKKTLTVPALVSLLGASFLLNLYLLNTPQQHGTIVIGVIDGDTIVLQGKSRVRLRQVDAPDKGRCGYDQAKKQLETLALNKYVRIDEEIPDQYGRGMALVYTGDISINTEMVASGWVRYHSDQTSQTDALKAASKKAKDEKLGIYGLCQSMTNTKNPTCTIKGNIDQNKSTDNRKYYLPGCAQYAFTIVEEDIGEAWFCTEKEAQAAGFTKAATCK